MLDSMVDYEFQLKVIRTELKHEQEMRHIHTARLDTIQDLVTQTAEAVMGLTVTVNRLAESLARLESVVSTMGLKIDSLVTAMLAQRNNGGAH